MGIATADASNGRQVQDAQVYNTVIRNDLQPVIGYVGSCEDLNEQQACATGAAKTHPTIVKTLADLAQLTIPASLTTDNTDLLAAMKRLDAACAPVIAAQGNVAQAYADNEYVTADLQVTAVLNRIGSDSAAG